ncbi:MAG: S8 family serine peptidase, partial [Candidatus Heimdallarchaeota archaeon]|nr:S8 family serine peptidase [Candidatus Heimdallarchaeota archaeon]
MKRKSIIGISILGVLLAQMCFTTGINVGATTTTVPGENIFIDSMRKYVLSFETEALFNQYLVENQPDRFYPELKMVIAKDWLSNRDDLNSIEGIKKVFDVTNTRFYFTENTGNQPVLIASTNGVKLTTASADMLNVSGLWAEGYDGAGVVICDIDTGINEDHVDFTGRILGDSKSFVHPDFGHTTTNPSIDDVQSHGSHTAGIAAGDGTGNPEYIGMAPEASLLVLKVSDINSIPTEAILGALDYALALGYVDVINFSIGGSDQVGQDIEEALMKILVLSGIVIACSAGNEASGPVSYFTAGSPGTAPQVISVAATTYAGAKASFSSMGPSADGFVKPDLAAPGVGIMSVGIADEEDYVSMDGTSMAAPHITGTAAVLIQAVRALGIDFDAGLIKTALMKSSEMRGGYLLYGAGLPDAGNAFHIIDDAPVNATGYPVILWAIPEMPIQWYETMPQGFQTLMYVESVSSTPYEDLVPVISGNISTIMSIDTTPETEPWTKNYALQFYVADDATVGVYEGYIVFETS